MIMIMISYNVLQKRLVSQKHKKYSPGKYALLLCLAVSIRWISIRFDSCFIHLKTSKRISAVILYHSLSKGGFLPPSLYLASPLHTPAKTFLKIAHCTRMLRLLNFFQLHTTKIKFTKKI